MDLVSAGGADAGQAGIGLQVLDGLDVGGLVGGADRGRGLFVPSAHSRLTHLGALKAVAMPLTERVPKARPSWSPEWGSRPAKTRRSSSSPTRSTARSAVTLDTTEDHEPPFGRRNRRCRTFSGAHLYYDI